MRRRSTPLLDAKSAVIAYQSGHIDVSALADSCRPVIARICRVAAYRLGRRVDADDLAQEVWLIFHQKIVGEYDPAYPIEPILLKYARNIGLGMTDNPYEISETDIGSAHEDGDTEGFIARSSAEFLDEDDVDRRIAIEKINKRLYNNPHGILGKDHMSNAAQIMPGVTLDTRKAAPVALPDLPRRAPAATKHLSPDQQELADIRNDLGLSREDFAPMLGVKRDTLAYYDSGKSKKVPPEVMAAARRIHLEEKQRIDEIRKKYKNKPMSRIIREYAALIDINPDDENLVAAATGTSMPTVTRWRNGNTRPDDLCLENYQKTVLKTKEVLGTLMESVKKAMGGESISTGERHNIINTITEEMKMADFHRWVKAHPSGIDENALRESVRVIDNAKIILLGDEKRLSALSTAK